MMFGIFTNRGDGYTYGYNQFEFATTNVISIPVQERLAEKLNLTIDEVAELLTSYNSAIDFDNERYDSEGNSFHSVYIENLDVI